MVESNTTYKSLSADGELTDAYDLLYNGEYLKSFHNVEKKLKKLKSVIDITNFNIVRLLCLNKMKRYRQANQILDQLKKDFLSKPELQNSEYLVKHFQKILKSVFHDSDTVKKLILPNDDFKTKTIENKISIIKEFVMNFDFLVAYSKINAFIKDDSATMKETDLVLMKLIRYELIYYLYKSGILKPSMTKKTYDELINDKDKIKGEKGYYDLVAKFMIEFDKEKFTDYYSKLEDKDKVNIPVSQISLDILVNEGKINDVVKLLVKEIKERADKCDFVAFDRLINVVYDHFKSNKDISFDDISQVKEGEDTPDDFDIAKPKEVLNNMMKLFDHVTKTAGKNLNMFKSGVLASLLMYHNMILIKKDFPEKVKENIYNLIVPILDKAVTKQSILFEVGKFFIYLDEASRKKIIEKYTITEEVTKENFTPYLFGLKLTSMLTKQTKENVISLLKIYYDLTTKLTGDIKLEKGERCITDDIYTLAYEIYETSDTEKDTKILYSLLFLGEYAQNKSPYNFDINLALVKLYHKHYMIDSILSVLKYMNLKGPLNETCSYVVLFPFMYNKKCLTYLTNKNEKWQNDNNINTRKTLWKMFTGKNFFSTSDLFEFLKRNQNSYYYFLLNFLETVQFISENNFSPEGEKEDVSKDYLETVKALLTKFNEMEKIFAKNQDCLIGYEWYCYKNYEYFDGKYEILEKNENYNKDNFVYQIDRINKEKNCLYSKVPGHYNNYSPERGEKIYKEYVKEDFLKTRLLCITLTMDISSIDENNLNEYLTLSEANKYQTDVVIAKLLKFLTSIRKDVENLDKEIEGVYKVYSEYKEFAIDKLVQMKSQIKYGNGEELSEFMKFYNDFKFLYVTPLANVTGGIVGFIDSKKKEIMNAKEVKMKLNSLFKAPLVQALRDLGKEAETMVSKAHKEGVIDSEMIKEISDTEEAKKNFSKLIDTLEETHKGVFKDLKASCSAIDNYVRMKI